MKWRFMTSLKTKQELISLSESNCWALNDENELNVIQEFYLKEET